MAILSSAQNTVFYHSVQTFGVRAVHDLKSDSKNLH